MLQICTSKTINILGSQIWIPNLLTVCSRNHHHYKPYMAYTKVKGKPKMQYKCVYEISTVPTFLSLLIFSPSLFKNIHYQFPTNLPYSSLHPKNDQPMKARRTNHSIIHLLLNSRPQQQSPVLLGPFSSIKRPSKRCWRLLKNCFQLTLLPTRS